jgi:hypothetical protein
MRGRSEPGATVRRVVTTVPDIPVVEVPAFDVGGILDESAATPPASIWAVDVPQQRRLTPVVLVVLGVVAGIAAMVLGAAAVVSAGRSAEAPAGNATPVSVPPTEAPRVATVESRVLALLAKPSTERIAFRGAPGVVLAVGSGGRAAILVRGLGRAPAGKQYRAWIVVQGTAPALAARLSGAEPAVFLTRRVGPYASVVISTGRPVAGPPSRNRIVALRD